MARKFTPRDLSFEEVSERWLDLDLSTSSPDEVREILDRMDELEPAPLPQPNPHLPPSGRLTCPMPAGWRQWDLGTYWRCPARIQRRAEAARRAHLGPALPCPHVRWELASDDASLMPLAFEENRGETWRWAPDTPSHIHTELRVAGHALHIDVVSATKYGPGRSYWEARIFVDGELAGRGGKGGSSLGGGGSSLPAIAWIGDALVIQVFDDRRGWPIASDAASQRPVISLARVLSGERADVPGERDREEPG